MSDDINIIDYKRKSIALEAVQQYFRDSDMRRASEDLFRITGDGIAKEYFDLDSGSTNEAGRNNILKLLNFFETISIGILNNVYDEKIVKDCLYSAFTDYYKKTKVAINSARKKSKRNSMFSNFEKIAKKWIKIGVN